MKERSAASGKLGSVAFDQLASGMTGSELHSILLAVLRQRAQQRAPRDVLAHYKRDEYCSPSPVDLRTSVALDAQLLEAAAGFEALELSPVAPLGTCSSVAPTSQDRTLSALRSTEVVSDPTNVLALECALRLRENPAASVHLTTIQRVIRAQPLPKQSGFTRHFRIFVLASAGQEQKEHGFTSETLVLHIQTMLRALDRLEHHGYLFGQRRVEILAAPERQALGDRIAERLGPVEPVRRRLDHPYYSGGLRYTIWATTPDAQHIPLMDGGTFDWVARLSSDHRAVYVASGAGQQLMAGRFRSPAG
jgi:hypothetical protein